MVSYYKVGDSFVITKYDRVYYKLRQVLQSAMIITNCDSTMSNSPLPAIPRLT